ncbi:hypothetical protein GCM10007079_51630 [Nocardiopsis terrae]|nr:hypothetical protein GCM10007079_51630 [Nocardiopsis terrae]
MPAEPLSALALTALFVAVWMYLKYHVTRNAVLSALREHSREQEGSRTQQDEQPPPSP